MAMGGILTIQTNTTLMIQEIAEIVIVPFSVNVKIAKENKMTEMNELKELLDELMADSLATEKEAKMLAEIQGKLERLERHEKEPKKAHEKEQCDHGLLKWSPSNKVVQCYNCGKYWGE